MQVNADPQPSVPVLLVHPVEQLARRALCFHAVEADVPLELDCHAELRLEDPELVFQRDGEGRELARAVCALGGCVFGVWRFCGSSVGNAAGAVDPYFAKHSIGKRF